MKSERVCVVTGANGGIGLSVCRRLLDLGCRVSAFDLVTANVEAEFAAEMRQNRVLVNGVDVSSREDVTRAVERTLRELATIDVLVCGAGIMTTKSFLEEDDLGWDKVLSVNLKGTFLCCQAVIPTMISKRSGCVVNIASKSGMQPSRVSSLSYNASKAGIIALSRDLAARLGEYGVRVNCVAPGYIDTPMSNNLEPGLAEKFKQTYRELNPIKRLGEPDDVAYAVEFLVSDRASYITGEILNVNGGAFMP